MEINKMSLGEYFKSRLSTGKIGPLKQLNAQLAYYLDEGYIEPVDAITYAICINNAIEILKLKNDDSTK